MAYGAIEGVDNFSKRTAEKNEIGVTSGEKKRGEKRLRELEA